MFAALKSASISVPDGTARWVQPCRFQIHLLQWAVGSYWLNRMNTFRPIGASYRGDHCCDFVVWAPQRSQVALQVLTEPPQLIPMQPDAWGYWQTQIRDIAPGTLYRYQLDGDLLRPDPASHYQPQDVHGPSQVIDHGAFSWQDADWQNIPFADLIIYELHVGTFTPDGTFAAIMPRLAALKELGITAIELMPIAQFPGDRNWGYDGVYPFGVQRSYGTPDQLKQLVNACHQHGIAVILDVVYNHFGPEGNYTANFAPYTTNHYHTPWGSAINMDAALSDPVRNFFIQNALYWCREYHIDGLRLDAVHAIYDFSAKPFLVELAAAIDHLAEQQGRPYYLIAESDLNDPKLLRPMTEGGYGLTAQWSDDFHHALHTLLTGETQGYYQDFGDCAQLVKAMRDSFVYAWDYSACRQRRHGNYAGDRPPQQFVVFSQNHDQVGNRMLGERLSHLVGFAATKLAAATVLLSPYIPLLFMGEDYGEDSPFLYFISHTDPGLVEAVRQGRQREFAEFHITGEPLDADDVATFQRCKLNWEQRDHGHHGVLRRFYQHLIHLRRSIPALKALTRDGLTVNLLAESVIGIHRVCGQSAVFYILNFAAEPTPLQLTLPPGHWHNRLDSSDRIWTEPDAPLPPVDAAPTTITGDVSVILQPHSIRLYERA